jgi:ABC-type thiamin/hydroxymethylpyrimidine transport system permease subunit
VSSRARLILGAAALGVAVVGYRYLSFEEFPNDHFVHLAEAQQILLGALPVRDFVERGIPLMAVLSAVGQMLLGEGLRSELIVIALAYGLAASLTFVVCASLSRSIVVGTLAALVPVVAYPISYSYPKLLATAIGFAAVLGYIRQPSRLRLLLVSASIACAFLLRHDLGAFVGLGVVAVLAVQHGISRTWIVETGRAAGLALLLVSPYLIWVQVYQGVGDYVRQAVVFSRREAQRANWFQAPRFSVDSSRPFLSRMVPGPVVNVRWQPDASDARIVEGEQRHRLVRLELNSPQSWRYMLTSWSAGDLEALVRDPLVADTHGIDRSAFTLQVPAPTGLRAWLVHVYGPGEGLHLSVNAIAALLYALWILPISALVALIVTWKQSSIEVRALVAMVIVVQLAMNLSMLRDPLDVRARDVLVPTALLTAYLGGLAWFRRRRQPEKERRLIAQRVLVVIGLLAMVGGAASLGSMWDMLGRTQLADGVAGLRERARTIRRRFSPPDQRTGPRSPVYQPVVEYIARCTPPDARLLTLTFAPELFFYSGRGFAGGQVSLSPGYFVTDRDASLLLARVAKEDVPLVILDSQTEREMIDGYPRIGAHVTQHYREVQRFPISAEKSFVVLAHNDRPACVS